jgi:hypothetical protein
MSTASPLALVARRAGTEVELAGSHEALASLVALLSAGAPATIPLHVPEGAAKPYEAFLRAIAVRPAEGLLLAAREGDTLVFGGAPRYLLLLGENIATLLEPDAARGEHLHVEHHDEHFYLAAGSLALVVMVR